ncbi:DUF2334 domain-containing protein [Thermococcus sp. 101 C5]|nr:DUF2334 domain-containing protein [Thermococcus sp. 101 C5]
MEKRYLAVLMLVIFVFAILVGNVTYHRESTPSGGNAEETELLDRGPSGDITHEIIHYERPTILIHDVAPIYFDEIREIIAILDEFNYSTSTILFVVPVFDTTHYNGTWDLRKHPEFVEYLHELREKGYRVELHGYAHTYHEFNCSYELAAEKLDNATSLVFSLGFGKPSLFLPPAWALNNETLRAILEHNLTVVTRDYLIFPNGSSERIVNREYTWYINETQVQERLSVALYDYKKASEEGFMFYLSLHPGAVNYGGGLEFLREFLKTIEIMLLTRNHGEESLEVGE